MCRNTVLPGDGFTRLADNPPDCLTPAININDHKLVGSENVEDEQELIKGEKHVGVLR